MELINAAHIDVNDSQAPNPPHAACRICYPMKLQLQSYCTSVCAASLTLHWMDFHSVSRSIPVPPVANNKWILAGSGVLRRLWWTYQKREFISELGTQCSMPCKCQFVYVWASDTTQQHMVGAKNLTDSGWFASLKIFSFINIHFCAYLHAKKILSRQ